MRTHRVPADSLKGFCLELLGRAQVREDVARHVAEGLVQASLRGVDSHGVRLMPHYLRALEAGRLNPNPAYQFERTAGGTGRLNGDHTFGHAAGAVGMGHAIELARDSGVGAVTVYDSSHFGSAAYFALMAAKEDLVGLSFTHADSLMLSYGGKRPFFGTNPICFAAPCRDEEPFCLDMATTSVTWNKVLRVSGDGGTLPAGWGVDADGVETQDPRRIAALHPIGGYKGFGLGMMVDVLCGLLTGMPVGRHISRMYTDPIEEKRQLGHFFMAFRIDRFVPIEDFKRSMQEMMNELREEPALDATVPVLVPGDPEKRAMADRRELGIPLSVAEHDELRDLGQKYGLGFPAVSAGSSD